MVKYAMKPKREGYPARHRFVEVDCTWLDLQPGLVPVPIRLTNLVRSVLTIECRFPCNITEFVTAMVADSMYWSLLHNEWSPTFDGSIWYKALLAEIMKKMAHDNNHSQLTTSKAEHLLEDHNAVIAAFYDPEVPVSKIKIPVEAHLLALFLIRDVARFDGSPFELAYDHAIQHYLGYDKSGETSVAGKRTVPPTATSFRWPMTRWEDLVSPPTDEYDGIDILPNKETLNSTAFHCHYMVSMISGNNSYVIEKPFCEWYVESNESPATEESVFKISSDLGKFMVGRGGVIREDIVPVPRALNELIQWLVDQQMKIQDEAGEELRARRDVAFEGSQN